MGSLHTSDGSAEEADQTREGADHLAASVQDAVVATVPHAYTLDDIRGLQKGDIIISKTGTTREVQDVIGDTVLFRVEKDFHGSDLDRCFMNNALETLPTVAFDTKNRGEVIRSVDHNIPHVILAIYRDNGQGEYVSGITTVSFEVADGFLNNTKIGWIGQIQKKTV